MSESKAQIHQYLTKDASEEIPAEESETIPFDWDEEFLEVREAKSLTPIVPSDIPPTGSRNGDLEDFLRSRGRSQDFIESYIRGWRQLDKKA